MSRYRLIVDQGQEPILREHCAHARYVWNLAVEQESYWRPGRGKMPGFTEKCRQLTEARRENPWLAAGSVIVQQQSLRDFAQAMVYFFNGTHGRPTWRKAGRHEGFRVVALRKGDIHRLSRRVGAVRLPKVGWVRFRWSRQVPTDVRSCRVTLDPAGRWHVAFAAIPSTIDGPGTGDVVGIDRGITVSAALSTGERLRVKGLTQHERKRAVRLQRKLSRSKRGSRRGRRTRLALARVRAKETDRRKDWVEKTSTDLARRFDTIRVENLNIRNMTGSAHGTLEHPGQKVRAKAGLNRAILQSGWGKLVHRLQEKAPGRVERIHPAFTSQRCSACGHIAADSRESQALYRCVVCGFTCNADVNAARNIAAGHAVTARGRTPLGERMNREPQLLASLA
jgi:putative transposase